MVRPRSTRRSRCAAIESSPSGDPRMWRNCAARPPSPSTPRAAASCPGSTTPTCTFSQAASPPSGRTWARIRRSRRCRRRCASSPRASPGSRGCSAKAGVTTRSRAACRRAHSSTPPCPTARRSSAASITTPPGSTRRPWPWLASPATLPIR